MLVSRQFQNAESMNNEYRHYFAPKWEKVQSYMAKDVDKNEG